MQALASSRRAAGAPCPRARPSSVRATKLKVVNAASVAAKSVSGRMAELKAQKKCVQVPQLVRGQRADESYRLDCAPGA